MAHQTKKPANRLDTARALLQKFTEMKTIPSIATRLVHMLEDDNSTFQEFEEVIKMDPTLVLRVLRLVNSSYYALRTKIVSVSEAIAFIGIDNLRNLIVIDALKHLFSKASGTETFSRNRLWLHCATVSISCQMIAERIFSQKGEDAFLCGILHDIGLIVEDQVAPDLFREFCMTFNPEKQVITEQEYFIMGTDHQMIGALLAEDWRLSEDIRQSIGQHHQYMMDVAPESLSGILQISEYLVFRLRASAFPEVTMALSPPLLLHMKGNIKEYKAIAEDLPEELRKAKEIYSLEKD
ncbi:MAG: HDOD domain-containing protein [Desulfobacteraceae bacterium]|nr:HDOD domain-containing protein [Desulfobacteraceae bacterium]